MSLEQEERKKMSDSQDITQASDNIAHECARIAGRLDLTGAINLPNLVALCQSCKEQLLAAAGAYWEAKDTPDKTSTENNRFVWGQFDFTKG